MVSLIDKGENRSDDEPSVRRLSHERSGNDFTCEVGVCDESQLQRLLFAA